MSCFYYSAERCFGNSQAWSGQTWLWVQGTKYSSEFYTYSRTVQENRFELINYLKKSLFICFFLSLNNSLYIAGMLRYSCIFIKSFFPFRESGDSRKGVFPNYMIFFSPLCLLASPLIGENAMVKTVDRYYKSEF